MVRRLGPRISGDAALAWLRASRNRIVKEGDLDIESTALMHFAYGYAGAADVIDSGKPDFTAKPGVVTRSITPSTRPSEYNKKIPYMGLPPWVARDSVLYVERKWIDRALPCRELLDALAQ